MIIALICFIAHCLFGPLIALLIVLVRELITERHVPKVYALFGLIPLVGWFLAALWPTPYVIQPRPYRYISEPE